MKRYGVRKMRLLTFEQNRGKGGAVRMVRYVETRKGFNWLSVGKDVKSTSTTSKLLLLNDYSLCKMRGHSSQLL